MTETKEHIKLKRKAKKFLKSLGFDEIIEEYPTGIIYCGHYFARAPVNLQFSTSLSARLFLIMILIGIGSLFFIFLTFLALILFFIKSLSRPQLTSSSSSSFPSWDLLVVKEFVVSSLITNSRDRATRELCLFDQGGLASNLPGLC